MVYAQVGEDEFGYMLANILKENNVNNEGMRFDPGARTALAFVTLRKDGEREFMFYRNPSADMLLQEAELDLELIRKVTTNDCDTEKVNIILNRISVNVMVEGVKSLCMKNAKHLSIISLKYNSLKIQSGFFTISVSIYK